MKRTKQILSLLLALTLTLSLVSSPVQSHAAGRVKKLSSGYSFSPETGIQKIKGVKSNKGGQTTRPILTVDESDIETLQRHVSGHHVSSMEEASDYIRQQVKLHNASITVVMDDYSYNEGDEADILHQTWKNTGKGDEGYYLAMQVGGYNIIPYSYRNVVAFFVNVTYRTTLEQEEKATKTLQKLEDSLWKDYKGDKEKYLKMMYVFLSGIDYDYDHLKEEESNPNTSQTAHTAYAAIVKKKAVCSGLAAAFYRAMLDKGINCMVLTSDTHAWNAVELDGKWYECDPTWDIQKLLTAKYCMITREDMESLEEHTVKEAPYYDLNELDSLNWSDTKLSSNLTKLIVSVKKKVLTYTTKNKGKQDVVVKDQDGNVLLEGADYNLNVTPGGNYTVTATQNDELSASGSYQVKLQNPKILSIKMEKKKEDKYNYKVRFIVKVSKVPGAKTYTLLGATTQPAKGTFTTTTTGKKQYLVWGYSCSSKTTTLTTSWISVNRAKEIGHYAQYEAYINKDLKTSINRRYNLCFYVQANSETIKYQTGTGYFGVPIYELTKYYSNCVGGVLPKTKMSVKNPKAYVVTGDESSYYDLYHSKIHFCPGFMY